MFQEYRINILSGFCIAACILSLFILPVHIFAAVTQHVVTRNDWHADDSLIADVHPSYEQIRKIQIEDFVTNDDTVKYNTKEYVAGLYTYLAKQYDEDLPYSYFVGWDGSIYEGAKGGMGVKVRSDASNALFIGYLDDGEGITNEAMSAFSYLLPLLSQQTGVGQDGILASSDAYTEGKFGTDIATDAWVQQVVSIKNAIKTNIPATTTLPTYTVSLGNIQAQAAKDGNILVAVPITNAGDTVLYGRVFAGTDKPTPLAVSNVWISGQRSNVTLLSPLSKGSSSTVSFEIPSKLSKGVYILALYTDSAKISGSDFQITVASDGAAPSFTVAPLPAAQQITITSTTTGTLNVHDSPSLSGKIVAKVKVGQTFTVLDTSVASGVKWYKISYDGTNSGWVDGDYTKN